jgi:hypothetical protein
VLLDYLLKPSVVKLIIFYFPAKPGLPIGGNVVPDVGEVSLSCPLRELSKGVNLLLLKDRPPPATFPEDFIGIRLMNEVVAVFDILEFL